METNNSPNSTHELLQRQQALLQEYDELVKKQSAQIDRLLAVLNAWRDLAKEAA